MKRLIGLGLIELMICLVLSTLIVSLLVRHYLTTKQHTVFLQAALVQNYDLHVINTFIRHSIYHAGFTPCVPLHRLIIRDTRINQSLNPIEVISAKNHILRILRMSEYFSTINEIVNIQQVSINNGNNDFSTGQIVLIADCFHAEIVVISHVQKVGQLSFISFKKPLHFTYTQPTYMGEWLDEQFYVKKNKKNQSSLFYKNKHAEALSNEVESFTAQLQRFKYTWLVKMTLQLKTQKPLLVQAAVRTP